MDNKSMIAYQAMKEKIISGEWMPLSEVSEEALQKELEISRTPIREAIQRLEKEHFLMVYPRRGTIVSDLTLDWINSIYEIRLLNEPYMAKISSRYIQKDWIIKMREDFSSFDSNKSDTQKKGYFIELDRELHDTLTSHTHNLMMKDMFQIVNAHNHRIRVYTSHRNKDYEKSIQEHLAILEALEQRDEDRIEETVRAHLLTAKREAFEYYY